MVTRWKHFFKPNSCSLGKQSLRKNPVRGLSIWVQWTRRNTQGLCLITSSPLPLILETLSNSSSLGQEDPLEEGMATHSSILAWETPLTEQPVRLQSLESQRVEHVWAHMHYGENKPSLVTHITQRIKSCNICEFLMPRLMYVKCSHFSLSLGELTEGFCCPH